VPTAIASEAARLGELGLSDQDLARATGAARSTARGWLAERSAPTGERAERLIELAAMVERLERLMAPDYIPLWLRKPIPALDDGKPLDLIGAGEYRGVAKVISGLEDPGAV
jgi:transcriptional regulator with XRE-family HTH domain